MRAEKRQELESLLEKHRYVSKKEVKPKNRFTRAIKVLLGLEERNFIKIKKYEFLLTDGTTIVREVLGKHGGTGAAASTLPISKNDEVVLVVQPRPATEDKALLEIPAGYIDNGEEPIDGALRELVEETGLKAEKEDTLSYRWYYQDTGTSNAKIHLFIAQNCVDTFKQHLDKDENISLFRCTVDEMFELYEEGMFKGPSSNILVPKVKELVYSRKK